MQDTTLFLEEFNLGVPHFVSRSKFIYVSEEYTVYFFRM
jgi:hypothetical protein